MRLIALVENLDHVCCRYRISAFRPYFEQAGHHLDIKPFPGSPWAWLSLKQLVEPAEAVIVQRRLLPSWQVRWLRRVAPLLLFDFDDAVFLRDSYSPKGMRSQRRARRFANLIKHVDHVVAGNSFLRGQAAYSTRQERITAIPTCVDPTKYPLAKHERAGDGVQMVWVGSSSTLQGLEAIRLILEDMGLCWPGMHLKLICDRFIELNHLPVTRCPWSEATEEAAIASADIGISWLPDDLWSRGKCGLKVLQYMAAGLPVVANPVGVQTEMIDHGETGFLANTATEWSTAIGRLAHDPDLRTRMGRAGRTKVEKEYSVASGAARWLQLVNRLQIPFAKAG